MSGSKRTYVYIILDDSNNSKFLKSELTRTWNKGIVSDVAMEMSKIQQSLASKIILIDRYDINNLKYRNLKCGYPCYAYGDYEFPTKFPDLMFNEVSYPLRSTDTIIHNIFVDDLEWRVECETRKDMAVWKYKNECLKWVMDNFSVEFNRELEKYAPGDEDDFPCDPLAADRATEYFRDYDGFPRFEPPEMPPSPYKRFPWEE